MRGEIYYLHVLAFNVCNKKRYYMHNLIICCYFIEILHKQKTEECHYARGPLLRKAWRTEIHIKTIRYLRVVDPRGSPYTALYARRILVDPGPDPLDAWNVFCFYSILRALSLTSEKLYMEAHRKPCTVIWWPVRLTKYTRIHVQPMTLKEISHLLESTRSFKLNAKC